MQTKGRVYIDRENRLKEVGEKTKAIDKEKKITLEQGEARQMEARG